MSDLSPEFIRCVQAGRLVKVEIDERLIAKELDLAHQDLSEGTASVERGSYKWATVQAYYAMFHAARALVFQQGYREKGHRCLAVALREFYVRTGRLKEQFLVEIEDARALREEADYRGIFSATAAEHSIAIARKFIGLCDGLISTHP